MQLHLFIIKHLWNMCFVNKEEKIVLVKFHEIKLILYIYIYIRNGK